jgi:hypothetical protein
MGQKENHQRSKMRNIGLYHKKLKPLVFALLAGLIFTVTAHAESNLLRNGNFNSSLSGNWISWTADPATGFARMITGANSDDGTPYLEVGEARGTSSGNGEVYQMVSAIPNATYTLSCDSSVAAWWWPRAQMGLEFMDVNHKELQFNSLDCAAAITNYDIGLPWKHFTITTLSPPGTASARVQFYCPGHGDVFFDNAVLTASTPTILIAQQESNGIALT